MIDAIGLDRRAIPIAGLTRVSHTVFERSSGQEYRFVPEGPALARARSGGPASPRSRGSMPTTSWRAAACRKGVPADFYARIARSARERGVRFVLDTSGEALRRALEVGVHLIKPNLGELERLLGRALPEPAAQEAAATAPGRRWARRDRDRQPRRRRRAARDRRTAACACAAPAIEPQERGRRGRQLRRRDDPRARRGPRRPRTPSRSRSRPARRRS